MDTTSPAKTDRPDDRMDFTVIGPAVNEASRIAGMCQALDRDILFSRTFANAAGRHRNRLLPLGHYGLRGIKAPQALFTLNETD